MKKNNTVVEFCIQMFDVFLKNLMCSKRTHCKTMIETVLKEPAENTIM